MFLFLFSPLAFGQVTYISLEDEGDYRFFDVFFLNEEIGFVGGVNYESSPSKSVLFKTINGGESWEKLPVSIDYLSVFGISFIDENVGYIGLQDGDIYKTIDGGNNFIKLNTSNIPFTLDYKDIHFIDENQGVFLGIGAIYKTYDGAGAIHIVYDNKRIWEKVQFANENVAYALGFEPSSSGSFDDNTYNNVFIKTTDQGETWEVVVDSLDYHLRSFYFLNETTAFACSYRDEIYKSTDAGQSWEIVAASGDECPPALFDITFFNNKVGYAIGGTEECFPVVNAVLWETRDGGESWERILKLEGEDYFRKIVRTSNNSGLIVAKRGKIFQIHSDDIVEIKELELTTNLNLQFTPNPFQENLSLQFDLPKPSIVNIELYTIEGKKQTIFAAKRLEIGLQSFDINPTFSSTSNTYFIEVTIDGEKQVQRVIQYK